MSRQDGLCHDPLASQGPGNPRGYKGGETFLIDMLKFATAANRKVHAGRLGMMRTKQ